jgi:hypothetical protein
MRRLIASLIVPLNGATAPPQNDRIDAGFEPVASTKFSAGVMYVTCEMAAS